MFLKLQRFKWVSSSDSDNDTTLKELDEQMFSFYSEVNSRKEYQEMVDEHDSDIENPGEVTLAFLKYVRQFPNKKFLEVGCGNARIYKFLEKYVGKIDYCGVEVSKEVISKNQIKFPSGKWLVASVYDIPAGNESIDICYSFYVLEHLVYPERALNEMMRTVKKEGFLILIFPDFAASGRFASQRIGWGYESTAKARLKKGKFVSALISLYDSRIRLPKALKSASEKIGRFPVNISPYCLSENRKILSPDIDAVYIASKKEVEQWGINNGHRVLYPEGKAGIFRDNAFLVLQKK